MPIVKEPDYYQEFRCIAKDCRTTCCKTWRIDVNRSAYNKLRSAHLQPELKKKVEAGLTRQKNAGSPMQYAYIQLNEEGYCPFLDDEALCGLQRACGPGILPIVCKTFPRKSYTLGRHVSQSCSSACEEVVNLLWKRPLGLKFRTTLQGARPVPDDEEERICDQIERVTDLAIATLQNRFYPLDGRMILLGITMKALEQIADSNDTSAFDAWHTKHLGFTHGNDFKALIEGLPKNPLLFLSNNICTIDFLSLMTTSAYSETLREYLNKFGIICNDSRYSFNVDRYLEQKQLMERICDDYLIENVVVNEWFNGLFPFNSQTVWDGYMQFCITYSLLKFLLTGAMTEDTKEDDVVDTVVLWSRILLHNGERLKGMTKEFHDNESDTLAHMAVLVNG